MVGSEQVQPIGQAILSPMGKLVVRSPADDAAKEQVGKIAIPGDLSKGNDDPKARQGCDLIRKVSGAVTEFAGKRFVTGRGTAYDGGDPCMAEFETVVAVDGLGFGGEPKFVQHGVHECAGAIASEGAPSAIGSMSSGGEADDQDASLDVAETWNRATPIKVILVGSAACFGDAGTVGAETGAEFTANDPVSSCVANWVSCGVKEMRDHLGKV
jgi:hypothetical protein